MLRSQKRMAAALGVSSPVTLLIAAVVVGGSLLTAWVMSRSIIGGASPILAFWTAPLTDVPAQASVTTKFDIHAALRAAPANAPIQNASAVACTYVLTDGHRCD